MPLYFSIIAALAVSASYAAYATVLSVHLDRFEEPQAKLPDAGHQAGGRWQSSCFEVRYSPTVRECGSLSTVGPWAVDDEWRAQATSNPTPKLMSKVPRRRGRVRNADKKPAVILVQRTVH